jgi:hypothetical protein
MKGECTNSENPSALFSNTGCKKTGREEILDLIEEYNIRFGAIAS